MLRAVRITSHGGKELPLPWFMFHNRGIRLLASCPILSYTLLSGGEHVRNIIGQGKEVAAQCIHKAHQF